MNWLSKIIIIAPLLWSLFSCNGSDKGQREIIIPSFPYQAYLDSMGKTNGLQISVMTAKDLNP